MSTETAMNILWTRLHELRETALALRLTVVEDRPHEGATLLVERLGDEAEELVALVERAVSVVGGAMRDSGEMGLMRRQLFEAHDCVARATHTCWSSYGAPERHLELRRLARRGGPGWNAWVLTLLGASASCREPLRRADAAARATWSELVERASLPPAPSRGAAPHPLTVHNEEERHG